MILRARTLWFLWVPDNKKAALTQDQTASVRREQQTAAQVSTAAAAAAGSD